MRVLFLSSLVISASAFLSPSSSRRSSPTAVFSTTEADIVASVDVARDELMQLSRDYKDQYGVIIIDTKAKESFRKAVEKLESVAEASTDSSLLVGDWSLVCSSASSSGAKIKIDTQKIPFFNEGPVRDIRNTLNDSIGVVQRIKFGDMSNSIDAIDHVIDYSPPNQLSSFMKNVPDAIKNLDINPFKVSDTKVILKHKAEVEATVPLIKTKLSLQSVVVNVAGESKNLDPKGADVLGINIPFGEFLNAGSFETTYLDDSMRVSRSKVGPVDQIRVFVKTSSNNSDSDADEEAVVAAVVEEEDLDDDEIVEVDADDDDEIVDSAVDAEVVDEKKDNGEEHYEDSAPSDIEN